MIASEASKDKIEWAIKLNNEYMNNNDHFKDCIALVAAMARI